MKRKTMLLLLMMFLSTYAYSQQSTGSILKRLNKEIKELNFSYE